MATYNNKHWLLSHVRNSFIATDDTGLCEAIMLSEDMPSQYAAAHRANALAQQQQQRAVQTQPTTATASSSASSPSPSPSPSQLPNTANDTAVVDFFCYPGLDHSDDEDNYPEAHSYDIQMEHGGFIHRSNTAQKLDKMKLASKRAAKIKNVKCLDPVPASQLNSSTATITDSNANELNALFVRKADFVEATSKAPPSRALADQLARHPRQPQNAFQAYARFDGSGQRSSLTKTIRVFLTMLPPALRNYPLQMCVLETARIQEFIGLICYRATVEHAGLQLLQSVRCYALHITEEDGEVDADFPPLDPQEPCAKFSFSHLSLVERRAADVRQDARTMSLSSEVEALQDTLLEDAAAASAQQSEALRRMLGHTTKMEAPMYRSYQLQISRKGFFRTDIQLGISAEKLEIDPVQQHNSRFWSHQKAISHSMDAVVWCEITDEPSPSRAVVKIVYCPRMGGEMVGVNGVGGARLSLSSLSDRGSNVGGSIGGGGSNSSSSSVGGGGGSGSNSIGANAVGVLSSVVGGTFNGQRGSSLPATAYRSYKFITDAVTAQEIVDKVRNILEVRSSPARREYMQRYAPNALGAADAAAAMTALTLEKRRKPFKKLFN